MTGICFSGHKLSKYTFTSGLGRDNIMGYKMISDTFGFFLSKNDTVVSWAFVNTKFRESFIIPFTLHFLPVCLIRDMFLIMQEKEMLKNNILIFKKMLWAMQWST